MQSVIAQHGSDAWWSLTVEQLLPASLRQLAGQLRKGEDTMDVWFDSGSSWSGVVDATAGLRFPADLYLEGSDQHRGKENLNLKNHRTEMKCNTCCRHAGKSQQYVTGALCD